MAYSTVSTQNAHRIESTFGGDQWDRDRHSPEQKLAERFVTTGGAAKLLQVSREGARKLALAGQIRYEETLSGQLLFRYGAVMKLVQQRAAARIQRRGQLLAAVRTRMLKAAADGEACQLMFDFRARLRLVGSRGKGRQVA